MTFVRRHGFLLGLIVLVLLKFSLMADLPFVARSNYPQDDSLFVQNALYILAGDWLGPFNQNTLLRGPMYPLWMAFVNVLGVPLIQANDLLYLFACLVTIAALSEFTRNRLVLFVAFSFLYLAPHSYDYATISHAFRQSIYPSLALLVFSSALGLGAKLIAEKKYLPVWSILFGSALVVFWYVREEGVWVLPALLILQLGVLTIILIDGHGRKRLINALVYLLLVPLVVFLAVSSTLKIINKAYYGEPLIVEIKSPEFQKAYNALLSVEPRVWQPRIHVKSESLDEIYKVSPKMLELKPSIDKAVNFWGGQLQGAALFFSFRDAVAYAGYYDRGLESVLSFYDELGTEILEACEANKIRCGKQIYSMVPLWQPGYTEEFPHVFRKQFSAVVRFKEFNPGLMGFYSSYVNKRYTYNISRLTHNQVRRSKEGIATSAYPDNVRDTKLDILRVVGDVHQAIRPALFYLSLVILLGFLISDAFKKQMRLIPLFAFSSLISVISLVFIITIIHLTSFSSLFRQRHGPLALVSLIIVVVFIELYRHSFPDSESRQDNLQK